MQVIIIGTFLMTNWQKYRLYRKYKYKNLLDTNKEVDFQINAEKVKGKVVSVHLIKHRAMKTYVGEEV
jgi:hypothetical protein